MSNHNLTEIDAILKALIHNLGLQSILCYGSYALGLQDDKSDIDLLIIADNMPSTSERQKIYAQIPNLNIVLMDQDLSHWETSWTPVNDNLEYHGRKIEIGFNTTDWVEKRVQTLINQSHIIAESESFRPHLFLGLLEYAQCLYDKNGFIGKMKAKIRPYPTALKKAIVKSVLPLLKDNYEDLVHDIDRNIGILTYQFRIFMLLDEITQLLWVINDVYDPASKRTEVYLFKLKKLPEGFENFINQDLAKCYENPKVFIEKLGKVKDFIEKNIDYLV